MNACPFAEHVTYLLSFIQSILFKRKKSPCAWTYRSRWYIGRWWMRVLRQEESWKGESAKRPAAVRPVNLRAASRARTRGPPEKWQVNGTGWRRAKDCSRRIEKVTRLPGADNHLRLPFARASNPFLPTLLCHICRWVFISLPSRRRDTRLKNRDLLFKLLRAM